MMLNRKLLAKVAPTLFKRNYTVPLRIPRTMSTQAVKEHYSQETLSSAGYTPLHFCFDPAEAEKLLTEGADPNARSLSGQTPLHTQDNPPIVEWLLWYGADVHARDYANYTPLHTCRNPYIAKSLVENGGESYAVARGWTASAFSLSPEIEQAMNEAQEKKNAQDQRKCRQKVLGVISAASIAGISLLFYSQKEKTPVNSESAHLVSNNKPRIS